MVALLLQKMGEWSQKWISLRDCAEDEGFNKRMEEIQKKLEKAMKAE